MHNNPDFIFLPKMTLFTFTLFWFRYTLFDSNVNWCYYTEPQKHLNNRKLYWPRAKVSQFLSTLYKLNPECQKPYYLQPKGPSTLSPAIAIPKSDSLVIVMLAKEMAYPNYSLAKSLVKICLFPQAKLSLRIC